MGEYRSGFAGIIGRPNVGKSTLLNRLVGQKIAIMSDKPQTTRNRILGILTTDRYQIVFLDTPGIHKPKHQLGEYMVTVAQKTLEEVDVILYVVDVSLAPGLGEEFIIAQLQKVPTPKILVLNKIDLVEEGVVKERESFFRARLTFNAICPVSALEGTNVSLLPDLISSFLPQGPPYYPADMVTDQPERFIMAELIREQVLRITREEVPHAVAVVVEEIVPRPNNYLYVEAIIYCERESQKGILVGQGGQRLKEIGTRAREEIEALLGNPIYLDLRVKVKKNWRRQAQALRQLGYDRRFLQ